MANSFTFSKEPGGGLWKENSSSENSLVNPIISVNGNIVTVSINNSQCFSVDVSVDTAIIDLTATGGNSNTYTPSNGTPAITARNLEIALMNVFNPLSNVLTA